MNMADTVLNVQAHWTRLRPIIQKAIPLMGGTHDEQDLIAEVMAGRMTFWPGEASFLLACIETYPKLKRLHVLLANGDEAECIRIGARVEAWAKAMGASEVLTAVRPGIARQVENGTRADNEFRRQRTVYVRKL